MSNEKNSENLIEYVLGNILCNNKLTISTAESCTGGMVASKLISFPGISSSFLEGVVTYSNEAKCKRLGVKKATLEKYGAVSKETAKEMVEGIARESNSDISIATTGIAGPGGGTDEKPVGLVYIAVYIKGIITIEKCNFNGNREKVRSTATNHALEMLRSQLINNNYK